MQIGIAGAGIMGRLLAWQLLQAGHNVSLFDKDPIETGTAAAYTAAGMLTPYTEVESAEWDIYHMGMQGLCLWPQIAKALDSDLGFQQSGSLIVAHPNDAADLQRFHKQLVAKLQGAEAELVTLDQQQLAQHEPELASRFNQGLYLPNEAWLCNQKTMAALANCLIRAGVKWHANASVEKLSNGTIYANSQAFKFELVIDCRGLGAQRDINQLRGVRGELIWIEAPEVQLKHMVRLMHPRYRLYLVPREKQQFVIGATQIESEDYSPISVRSSLELLSALYSLHSGFAEARVIASKTNCRPALLDNLPAIEFQDGLIRVNGLFRHGFLLAPVLAQEVCRFLEQGHQASPFGHLFKQVA